MNHLILYLLSHRHKNQLLKMQFSDSGDLITCKSIKISVSKKETKNNTFFTKCSYGKVKDDVATLNIK